MKKRTKILLALIAIDLCVLAFNSSRLAGPPADRPSLMAHRGLYQTYNDVEITDDMCTAAHIDPITHGYIENTVQSIQAALDYGADIVEIDVQPIQGGEFALFREARLDCRTNGTGPVSDHSLESLKTLDLGFGYTADGGQTFPFRGHFVGEIKSLDEVLTLFPDTEFMIHYRGQDAAGLKALAAYVPDSEWTRLSLIGSGKLLPAFREARAQVQVIDRNNATECLFDYMKIGWIGAMPQSCHHTIVPVPLNYRRLVWGWPHRFERRLMKVGSRSMLMGNTSKTETAQITIQDLSEHVPQDYAGMIYTSNVNALGPFIKNRAQSGE